MFWIVDSILMRKRTDIQLKEPGVYYHKSQVKYNKLEPEDSCSDCEVIVQSPTDLSRTLESR